MEAIVVAGASGHAKVVVDVLEKEGKFRIAGFLDSRLREGQLIMGYPVLGADEEFVDLVRKFSIDGVFVAIGDNYLRATVAQRLEQACPGIPFVSAVHPGSSIARDVLIGRGVAIMAGVSINSTTVVGDFSVLNTGSSLDHDCTMGEFGSLGPGARVGGGCRFGRQVVIGIGAVVSHGIEIGENTVLGAGALALHDIESHVVAYGSPARVIRSRRPGEKCF